LAAKVELDQLRVSQDELDRKVEFHWLDWLRRTHGDHGFCIVGSDNTPWLIGLFVLLSIVLNYADAFLDEEFIEGLSGNGSNDRFCRGADPIGACEGKLQCGR